MKNNYELIVGNIGSVHQGCNRREAMRRYRAYVKDSQTGLGRSGNEPVVLMNNGEPIMEYDPADRKASIRKGYRFGVAWIADNDNSGDPDALDPLAVANYVSTCLLADLFGKARMKVAADVVAYRKGAR
jgi:hypothetical protein